MGNNSFGRVFTITTWGESHGKAIGVVVDGCPAGLEISEADIQKDLSRRRPGIHPHTSPRGEADVVHIYSGLFEGKTTGTPISIVIYNQDVDSSSYEATKHLLRPGHAHYTYFEKYGIFDYRGGGRSSARETACRVAAGAIAKKLLLHFQIQIGAYVKEVGGESTSIQIDDIDQLQTAVYKSPVFCPDQDTETRIIQKLTHAAAEGDSLGGIIELVCQGLPAGLGDPVYAKLEAHLASAMMGLPATKGFEIGSGFQAARIRGSEHNDSFVLDSEGSVKTQTNNAGGTLGGISTGMPIVMRIAFKPTSSIRKEQKTLDTDKQYQTLQIPEGSRHDPCAALRAVPVVEAMGALVLADALLMQRCARL